jgi:hypothetical protein
VVPRAMYRQILGTAVCLRRPTKKTAFASSAPLPSTTSKKRKIKIENIRT